MPGVASERHRDVTPERAQELLDSSVESRRISAVQPRGLAALIKEGVWVTDAYPVMVTPGTERLLAGHRQLQAVVLAGYTVHMLIQVAADDGTWSEERGLHDPDAGWPPVGGE